MYDSELFSKARLFIYRNARALDLARWRFHFESADKSEVLTALSAYQNKDGGFGWGLEADAWNPNSSPMQTCTATEILDETAFSDTQHPIIQGILAYLESGSSFDGSFWYKAIPSTNDHPHAPWWACTDNSTGNGDYNPTAALAGGSYSDMQREMHRGNYWQSALSKKHTTNCWAAAGRTAFTLSSVISGCMTISARFLESPPLICRNSHQHS